MRRIVDITHSVFNAAVQLRNVDDSRIAPPLVQARVKATIDEAVAALRRAEYSDQAVQDIAFALVALMDERALASSGGVRDHWIGNPLQLHYFQLNTAGELFFDHLAKRMAEPDSPETNDVLEVHFLCLSFGFMGKYRLLRGGEGQLFQLREDLGARLGYTTRPRLSPHGDRPRDRSGPVRRALPLVGISLVILALSVGFYAYLRHDVRVRAERVVEKMQKLQEAGDRRLAEHEDDLTRANGALGADEEEL